MANPQRLRYCPEVTEAFPFLDPLNSIPGIRAAWIERVPGLRITGDRDEAMTLLRPHHERSVKDFAGAEAQWWRAEQIHGTAVAIVPDSPQIIAPDGLSVVPGVDGLITREPGIALAIYNADCGAIWLADRKSGVVGLLHSGKKGTEGNILQVALDMMAANFDTQPADIVAVLSPCIRPPDYEMDIPTEIASQAERAGIGHYLDCGLNTAADLQRFYSYRTEMGKTGRMMALITIDTPQ